IVDSIIALFRVDFTRRWELADRQGVELMFISDPKKPAGGHVLAHAVTISLSFRKGKGEQRVCKVFDAPNLRKAKLYP
ncbi:unnamed protein product, partial [Brassica rapa]